MAVTTAKFRIQLCRLQTMSFLPQPSPAAPRNFLLDPEEDDADTASERSISLSSPADSPRHSTLHPISISPPPHETDNLSKRESHPYTVDTDLSSEADGVSLYTNDLGPLDSPSTSAAPSVYDEPKEHRISPLPTYPPSPPSRTDAASISSFASNSSRKARPESMLVAIPAGPLVLGIALVDFNHLVALVLIVCRDVYVLIHLCDLGWTKN